MDAGIRPKPENRQARIEARARELMIEAGVAAEFFTPHSPPWEQREVKIRNEALDRAREEVNLELGLPILDTGDDATPPIDWSPEPKDALRAALRERDDAERDRDKAATIARNAIQHGGRCRRAA